MTAACNLNSAVGFAPSDVTGAAGPTRLVEATNIEVGVYNNFGACAVISKVPLKTFFGATDAGETDFDPQVLYDRRTGRFFVTAETETSIAPNTDQYQYFAVSKDATASSWWIYKITLSQGATKFCKALTSDFWDYPHAGASSNRWFLTANVFPVAGGATGAILSIDKTPTLTGGTITFKCFSGLPFNLAPPIVLDVSTKSNFLTPGSGSGSTITSRVVTATGSTPGSANADTLATGPTYAITPWTAPPNAPQPGSASTLDSLDGRFQSQSLQSRGAIWNIHAENNAGRSAIRWYELNTASSASSTTRSSRPAQPTICSTRPSRPARVCRARRGSSTPRAPFPRRLAPAIRRWSCFTASTPARSRRTGLLASPAPRQPCSPVVSTLAAGAIIPRSLWIPPTAARPGRSTSSSPAPASSIGARRRPSST